jgi:hypothetical protein
VDPRNQAEFDTWVAEAITADPTLTPGGQLLDDVHAFLGRFVAFPSEHAHVAATLWAAHAHLMDSWESTPRIAFLSPEPGSGKTRALEVLELLVPRPLHAVNATPAALFRSVSSDAGAPTILFDEIDTLFGPKAKDNEDVRGMLNAGHRRGATALRCVVKGKTIEVEEFPAYCAVALAGLDDLPDTIRTRSVIVRMRRRAPHEKVEPFRHRVHAPEGHALADRLGEWSASIQHKVQDAWPDMPDGIEDRNADVWEPLLAVADVADNGSSVADNGWSTRARVAAVALVADFRDGAQSMGIRLLQDIRDIFDELESVAASTDQLLTNLKGIEEGPWADIRGKELDSRGLANRLRKYDIRSKNIRVGDTTPKGYKREDFEDAWSRYLPQKSATSATPPHPPDCPDCVHLQRLGDHMRCWQHGEAS